MKTLVLGLGNEILGDDAFGLVVARSLAGAPGAKGVDIVESAASGFRLIDTLEGYDRVLVIDSYLAPERPFGEIVEFDLVDDSGPLPGAGAHFYSFPQALAAARQMGMRLPTRIRAYCAVIHGCEFYDKGIAAGLVPAAEEITRRVLADLRAAY